MMLARRTGSSCRRNVNDVFSQALLEPGGRRGARGTRAEHPLHTPTAALALLPLPCRGAGDTGGNRDRGAREGPCPGGPSSARWGGQDGCPVQPGPGRAAPQGPFAGDNDRGHQQSRGHPNRTPARWYRGAEEPLPGDTAARPGTRVFPAGSGARGAGFPGARRSRPERRPQNSCSPRRGVYPARDDAGVSRSGAAAAAPGGGGIYRSPGTASWRAARARTC